MGFGKGEAPRLLRNNLSRSTFSKNIQSFKIPFENRGNLDEGFKKRNSGVIFAEENKT